jgi:hypothetical protein
VSFARHNIVHAPQTLSHPTNESRTTSTLISPPHRTEERKAAQAVATAAKKVTTAAEKAEKQARAAQVKLVKLLEKKRADLEKRRNELVTARTKQSDAVGAEADKVAKQIDVLEGKIGALEREIETSTGQVMPAANTVALAEERAQKASGAQIEPDHLLDDAKKREVAQKARLKTSDAVVANCITRDKRMSAASSKAAKQATKELQVQARAESQAAADQAMLETTVRRSCDL